MKRISSSREKVHLLNTYVLFLSWISIYTCKSITKLSKWHTFLDLPQFSEKRIWYFIWGFWGLELCIIPDKLVFCCIHMLVMSSGLYKCDGKKCLPRYVFYKKKKRYIFLNFQSASSYWIGRLLSWRIIYHAVSLKISLWYLLLTNRTGLLGFVYTLKCHLLFWAYLGM